jgi:acyl-CoA synthetase (NDP forming)
MIRRAAKFFYKSCYGGEMDIQKLLKKAKSEGRTALTEAESKQILSCYGVPVVEESVAATPEEAVSLADKYGFPVVLKGLGSKLTHKTERGLVHMNLRNKEEVREAAKAIALSAAEDLEGYLIQPMVRGRREFVAGLFCDPHFGPIVMFGLGGIFTEALEDVAFRIAPLSETQAELMIDELRSSRLLREFRGEPAVQREAIVRTLIGLSRLAVEWDDILEVDINPLIIDAEGRVTAVDALIIIGDRPAETSTRPHVEEKDLYKIFLPRTVAFIGASAQPGKWGNMLFTNVLAGGYEGKIFLVNAKGQDIAGRKVFKSISDIPDQVDLGVVTVPANKVLNLIDEFKAKGIRYMLLISSGFSETGDEGREMEKELVKAAADAGIVILGPNTMGICNPHANFYCTGSPCWPKPGSIGLVSQSGNLGTQLLAFAEMESIGIRAFCGSGNEAMITIEDYIRGFEFDHLTKTVVLYIESIKDGERFLKATQQVSRKKPIIVLKGGRTEAGNRAAASHTGALASDIKVFDAACRQAGAVVADQPMDLLDLSAAFSSVPLPKGKRVALMTLGGGWGVVATDLCIESGLEIPNLTADVIDLIDKILPPYWSRENPVDLVGEFDPEIPMKVVEALVKWDQCDAVIHLGAVGRNYFVGNMLKATMAVDPNFPKAFGEEGIQKYALAEKVFFEHTIRLMETYGKPILGVKLLDDEKTKTITEFPGCDYKGVAFLTPERAVKVLARMVEYKGWLSREGF